MKFSLAGSVVFLLVLTVIFFAGCTGLDERGPSVTSPQNISTRLTASQTPALTIPPQPSPTVIVEVVTNPEAVKVFGVYTWAEYRNNKTVTMPPNPRYQWESVVKIERSRDNYKGTPAIHKKITETEDYPEWIGDKLINTKNGWIMVTDIYFEATTKKILGGTMNTNIKGVAQPLTDLSADEHYKPEDKPSYFMGITPFDEMNITLTYGGTESVKVPAGTYPDARKYNGKFRDGTPITLWVAPGIPIPVQYQFPNKYLDGENPFQSYELKGWGQAGT